MRMLPMRKWVPVLAAMATFASANAAMRLGASRRPFGDGSCYRLSQPLLPNPYGVLYNERETRIRGLETVAGVYYRWDDLLSTLQQPNND